MLALEFGDTIIGLDLMNHLGDLPTELVRCQLGRKRGQGGPVPGEQGTLRGLQTFETGSDRINMLTRDLTGRQRRTNLGNRVRGTGPPGGARRPTQAATCGFRGDMLGEQSWRPRSKHLETADALDRCHRRRSGSGRVCVG